MAQLPLIQAKMPKPNRVLIKRSAPSAGCSTAGARANHHGQDAEDDIWFAFVRKGYWVERQALVCTNIYGGNAYVDLLVRGIPSFEGGLIVESKWQQSTGSVDEKYPYLVMNIKERYPYPTIIVLGGNGVRDGAREWLRNQVGHNLIAVFSIEEFRTWVNQTL